MLGRIGKRLGGERGTAPSIATHSIPDEPVLTLADGRTKGLSQLSRGDLVVIEAGEVIPCDGTVVEGIATVDESAITGESAPVIRESASDRSAVIGGTRVLSSRIVIEV